MLPARAPASAPATMRRLSDHGETSISALAIQVALLRDRTHACGFAA